LPSGTRRGWRTLQGDQKDPEKVFQYTNKANMVGVVTDGTRVLGLGISPPGGLP
jgi:malic enzyme